MQWCQKMTWISYENLAFDRLLITVIELNEYWSIKMIELSREDFEFKKSTKYPGKIRLLRAAKMIETTEFERNLYEEDATYSKRSIVGMIMSGLGWSGSTECVPKSTGEAVTLTKSKFHKNLFELDYYRQETIFMISGYVVRRLDYLDCQKKTNEEIVDWLKRMAE
jgi:hypothetical protein